MSTIITAKNVSEEPVYLYNIKIENCIIPVNGEVNLTDNNRLSKIQEDPELKALIDADLVVLTVNGVEYDLEASKRIIDKPIMLQDPVIGKNIICQMYNDINQDIQSKADVGFNTEIRKDEDYFEHDTENNTHILTIKQKGWYELSYNINWRLRSTQEKDITMETWIERNGSVIPMTSSNCSLHNYNIARYGTTSCAGINIECQIGDELILKASMLQGRPIYRGRALGNHTGLTIRKVY